MRRGWDAQAGRQAAKNDFPLLEGWILASRMGLEGKGGRALSGKEGGGKDYSLNTALSALALIRGREEHDH